MMRPVLRRMCKYESLKGHVLDLYDFAVMNEAIDVEEINKVLIAEAVRNNGS